MSAVPREHPPSFAAGRNRLVARSNGRRRQSGRRQRCGQLRAINGLSRRGPGLLRAVFIGVGIGMSIPGPCDSPIRRSRKPCLGRLEVVAQLIVELLDEFMPHSDERGRGVDDQHQAQDDRVPSGQAGPYRQGGPFGRHGSPCVRTNPDASNCVNQAIAFLRVDLLPKPRHLHIDDVVQRRRASRLPPDVAGQHFARDQMPLVSKQILEQLELSTGQVQLPLAADYAPGDQVHSRSAALSRRTSDGRPRRSRRRIRARSSGTANGLTR